MTIDPIPLRPRHVTPKRAFTASDQDKPSRPTIAAPVLVSKTAEKCIADIDRDLDCLYCVHGTLAGTEGVPDEALEALATLRDRMKRNIDTLYSLG
ncbi:MAG TPA: hypothetical protein VFO41_09465 [Alphaproteobacteria bacterium]|nr:hypothetical protein [Alphaproteobacteria bacterium]